MDGIAGGTRARRELLIIAGRVRRALVIPAYPMHPEATVDLAGVVEVVKMVRVQGELLFQPARVVVHVQAEEYVMAMGTA